MSRAALRTLAVFAVAMLMACLNEASPSEWPPCTYQGKTARQWVKELQNWEIFSVVRFKGGSAHYHLMPKETPFQRVARKLGLDVSPNQWSRKLPLLSGDPLAVPVLIELLRHRERTVRLLAMQALRNTGTGAESATPELLRLLDDPEGDIREAAAYALMSIDREAGEDAGLEYTQFGLVRHPPGTKVPRLRDMLGR